MNRRPAALYRMTVALIGILCLVVGIGALTAHLGIRPLSTWIGRIDPGAIERFVHSDWWIAVLIGGAVIFLWWGARLLGGVVRPTKASEVHLAGSDNTGTLTVAPGLLADAVGEELSGRTLFDSVTAKAVDDRGTKIIRITATAAPHRSYDEIAEELIPAVDHLRTAVAGSALTVQAMVHLEN